VPIVEHILDQGHGGDHFVQLFLNRAKLQQRDSLLRPDWLRKALLSAAGTGNTSS
jgi:hypothetical protein